MPEETTTVAVMELESKDLTPMEEFLRLNQLGLSTMFDLDNNNTVGKTSSKSNQIPPNDQTEEDKPTGAEIPSSHPIIYMKELDPSLATGFATNKGQQIFKRAIQQEYMNTYFTLSPSFHTQCEANLCGAGTLTMVLNALQVDPRRMWKYPWRWYDEYMINSCKPLDVVLGSGIDFDEYVCTMRSNKLQVEGVRASKLHSLESFRRDVKRATSSFDTVMIANYGRSTFNQTGSGHFSPIGGYDKSRDMVLIMDTARFKFCPHWVKLPLMWKAMQAKAVGMMGNTDDMPRGYYLVKKNEANPTMTLKLPGNYQIKIDPSKKEDNLILLENFLTTWNEFLNEKNKEDEILHSVVNQLLNISGEEKNHPSQREIMKFHTELQSIVPFKKLRVTKTYQRIQEIFTNVEKIKHMPLLTYLMKLWKTLDKKKQSKTRRVKNFKITMKNKTKINDSITLIDSVTILILFWPYRGTMQVPNNRMELQKFVNLDLNNFDVNLRTTMHEQIRTVMKTFDHLGHEITCAAEEKYFD